MADSTERTVKINIRVRPDHWERIERAAEATALTANQLVLALAMEVLDQRETPSTEAEIRVARASLFAAHAIARDLIANGREQERQEIQEIREFISTIVPDADSRLPAPARHGDRPTAARHDES